MVARITFGTSVRGIISYNENKVKKKNATCIRAEGFGCLPSELTFQEKFNRFYKLFSRNTITEKNAMHISLNFDPSEKFTHHQYAQITQAYMDRIGFGDQPYLLYEHTDAAHPHVHIVTTVIDKEGDHLETHMIGKLKSSPARREVEKLFGLVPAESKSQKNFFLTKAADLEAVQYGKNETKAEISKIVRTVIDQYRFTSFSEYKAVLESFNVTADRGRPGSTQFTKNGLSYSIINKEREKVGVAIKASSIYDNPIFKKVESHFEENERKRQQYKAVLSDKIEQLLSIGVDKSEFIGELAKINISAVFYENENGLITGITFIDHNTRCVFKGSDLNKRYGARAILARLNSGNPGDIGFNRKFVKAVQSNTVYTGGISKVWADWAACGLTISGTTDQTGTTHYQLGHIATQPPTFAPAGRLISSYLAANGINTVVMAYINEQLAMLGRPKKEKQIPSDQDMLNIIASESSIYFSTIFSILTEYTYSASHTPIELLREARKRRKRRS
ncbi:relaxase/mobilization nuclease domain-containing protein [Chitinophaga sp. CC14]|uniref:relaxase/mobilization nuclease domain-containing protein n=1 Tax=Chitinophaga sp. CC14 TaxID=3029199 RepID=UPI003B78355E